MSRIDDVVGSKFVAEFKYEEVPPLNPRFWEGIPNFLN